MLNHRGNDWWKDAVFYQIYPRSFQDTNGDGIGDIRGITQRLDYLRNLGVDGIWLSPVYRSPQRDNGYDVADYRAIDPLFGSMDDMDELIAEAKKRDMIIIMDIIANHTSNEHPWFVEAQSSRDNPYHSFYIWRDGMEDTPPDSTTTAFGEPSWTYVPSLGQYYYSSFSRHQPDLDWSNPKVREAIYDMIRFWADKGVGGFRMDAIGYIGKDLDHGIRAYGPTLHPYLREMRREAYPDPSVVVVGEAMETTLEDSYDYINPDGSEFSLIFQGDEIVPPNGDLVAFKWNPPAPSLTWRKKYHERWQQGIYGRGWNSLYMNNHDEPREIGIWGSEGAYREQSAKMLAAMLYLQQGTPFLYQGEELGMTNPDMSLDSYNDIDTLNFIERARASGKSDEEIRVAVHRVSRDNARTPMQWTDGPNAGFTDGEPWLALNDDYKEVNAQSQVNDPDSVYSFYRDLFRLRREHSVFHDGTFTLLDPENEDTFCYTRDTDNEHVLVQCSFSENEHDAPLPAEYEDAQVLLSNYPDPRGRLRPYETRVLLARK